MPRGVKGSGSAKKPTTTRKPREKAVVMEQPVVEATTAVTPARKPYPTVAERIVLADAQIERLTKLNESRAALVEKTDALLRERQEALAKSTAALEKAEAKRLKLIASANKPPKIPKEKLTPEERKARIAAGRAAKKAEREQAEALMAALRTSGKSVDELLAELKG